MYVLVQAQFDDLREVHERLRVESAAEIRRLRREAREGSKAAEIEAVTAGETAEEVSCKGWYTCISS